MRAARYYGKEDIQIKDDIPVPECGEGQVKVSPAFVGICGTDLHEYLGGPNFSPTSPHPVTKESIPITIGHEFSGTIAEVGKGVSHVKVGDKVAVQPTIFCGSCGACKVKAENACPNGGFVGLSGGGGGMSEFVVVPQEAAFPLPSGVDLDIGALVEPLAVGWHAVDASPIAEMKEPNCLVMGGGPIGLAVVQVLLARGAKTVICAEVAKKRQDFAKEFGAHHVLDPTKVDIESTCLEICGGLNGPDLVFDCAGVPKSLETACKTVRSRGTVVNVAIWEKEVPFNPNWLVFREASYKAVLGYQAKDFQGVIDALGEGKLKPQSMITSKILMDKLVKDGYLALINEKDKHVKILVDVQGSL
ncbi:Putative alcohol dehydrogenase, zinc-type, GroES-like superfamily, NAD(P)-binding domain superfamily [Septoria linicola]|uniref:Alcohol dehydrogenase, zinc-type, GroES-like superfamily, NAD(P)-binding domain superfamily n=1 Tax=Septoria linicola TaxID=215465 RepID=A0A9Q9AWG0_9PEZI|nr:putative alcohol dehydrogenase, zinc-type, GroES-like superfamily, NAD(P)-binding domain superfamily [Septoria linicola]USW51926.1 Putative alcohol dehydrogenase, zinc-type, GroES-like superfamily, NAD(P)-binding domain superfamily [Septoria linicola]